MGKELKSKITWGIVIPLATGMVFIGLVASLPLFLKYPQWLDYYREEMVENQGYALRNVSWYLAEAAHLNVMQYSSNLMLIAGTLIKNYYQKNLDVKPDFNGSSNYINGVLFDNSSVIPYGYNETTKKSYQTSMWYFSPSIVDPEYLQGLTQMHLKDSAVFDSFLRPMAALAKNPKPFFSEVYLGFSEGLYYVNPTSYGGFSSSIAKDPTCKYNEFREPHFDPRCRPWYKTTASAQSQDSVTLTTPYLFINSKKLGQTACYGVSNLGRLRCVVCIDYKLESQRTHAFNLTLGDEAYSYVLTVEDQVLIHPKLNRSKSIVPSITELEFGSEGDSSEKSYYRRSILPLFRKDTTTISHYEKNGKKILIAVSPISLRLDMNKEYLRHWASLAVVIPEHQLIYRIDELKDEGRVLLVVEVCIFTVVMTAIILLCYYLSKKIAGNIIAPIDKLVAILKRMRNHDLDVDIMEHYTPGPPEISSLYQVFDTLKVVLRFEEPKYFQDYTGALLNYAQALKLFQDYGNSRAAELCYFELGALHFKESRFEEAATCYRNSMELAREQSFSLWEITKRKVLVAKCMMLAKDDYYYAYSLFTQALEFYEEQNDLTEQINCLLDMAEGILKYGENSEKVLNKTSEILKARKFGYMQEIFEQRYLFFKGLNLERKGQIKSAASCYVESIENFYRFDSKIRKEALERLLELFQNYKLPTSEISSMLDYTRDCPKDIALIFDSRVLTKEIYNQFSKFANIAVDSCDRVALISFYSEVKTVFNLTRRPKEKRKYEPQDFKFSHESRLYDAVLEGVKQVSACSFKRTSGSEFREQWIIVLSDGEDIGSETQLSELKAQLAESGANLIFLAYGAKNFVLSPLEDLVRLTPRGLLERIHHKDYLKDSLKNIASYMYPFKVFLFN